MEPMLTQLSQFRQFTLGGPVSGVHSFVLRVVIYVDYVIIESQAISNIFLTKGKH